MDRLVLLEIFENGGCLVYDPGNDGGEGLVPGEGFFQCRSDTIYVPCHRNQRFQLNISPNKQKKNLSRSLLCECEVGLLHLHQLRIHNRVPFGCLDLRPYLEYQRRFEIFPQV